MLTFVRSNIAKLYCTFSFGGVPVAPTNLQITIYHGDDIVVGPTTMTYISLGYYYYEFTVPETWDEDFYDAVYSGKINSQDFKQEETFKVIAQDTLSGADDPTAEYCDLGDVQAELVGVNYNGLDGIDAIIVEEIYNATHEVDALTNRTWKQARETLYLDGYGTNKIACPKIPINEVHECVLKIVPSVDWYTFAKIVLTNTKLINGVAIATASTSDEFDECDLIVDCITGELTIPERVQYIGSSAFPFWNYTFNEGNKNIKLDLTFGYTSTSRPREIKRLAAKIVAKEVLLRKGDQISGGSTNNSFDGVGSSFQGVPYGDRIDRLDKKIEEIRRRYKKLGIG